MACSLVKSKLVFNLFFKEYGSNVPFLTRIAKGVLLVLACSTESLIILSISKV